MALQAIKLYPPTIEGTLPAFYGTTLVVPFSMNRAVNQKRVVGFHIKIKTVQSNRFLLSMYSKSFTIDPVGEAIFELTDKEKAKFNVGQFYKIQMAYISADENNKQIIGHYSTVGVIKYTTEPTVYIDGLEKAIANVHNYQYFGVYSQRGRDITEKVYSYCFYLYDGDGNIVQTSGEQIHNGSEDVQIYESVDQYLIKNDLAIGKSFYIEYVITTANKMKVSSGRYRIMQKKFITPEIQADLTLNTDYENGYNIVGMQGRYDEDGVEYAATGTFKMLRSSEQDNYDVWHEMLRFALYGQQPSKWTWKDMTTKQGVRYKYALQQYNDSGLVSDRIETNEIYSDFEHAFLYDGKRQLKIKYNPKITSFKNNILESKVNTIGSKYPYIFRNGNVKYKEFPIAGLISCQSDEEFFFTNEEKIKDFDGSIDLVSGNISTEREFKLEVLEWLNNGKPKLFRSPSEGNYLVRLLNVSLSPEDALGRMLHNFTATAYEIDECSDENLIKYGITSVDDPTVPQLRWETINLDKFGIGDEDKNILNYKAASLHFEGMIAGDKLHIDDGILRPKATYQEDENGNWILIPEEDLEMESGYDVIIGSTGSYIIDLRADNEIISVAFKGSEDNYLAAQTVVQHQGSLTYGYYSKTQNRFDAISNIVLVDVPGHQFIGEHDILEEILNPSSVIQEFYWLRAVIREIIPIYKSNQGKMYFDRNQTRPVDWDDYVLYKVTNLYDNVTYYYDYHNNKSYPLNMYDPNIYFGDKVVEKMNLTTRKEYSIKSPKDLHTLRIGNGVMLEISYQILNFEYKVETSDKYPKLKELRKQMDIDYALLQNALRPYIEDENGVPIWNANYGVEEYDQHVEYARKQYEKTRAEFLIELEEALKAEEAIQGYVVV